MKDGIGRVVGGAIEPCRLTVDLRTPVASDPRYVRVRGHLVEPVATAVALIDVDDRVIGYALAVPEGARIDDLRFASGNFMGYAVAAGPPQAADPITRCRVLR